MFGKLSMDTRKTCLSGLIQQTHIGRYFQFKFDQITFFNSVFNGDLENNPLKKLFTYKQQKTLKISEKNRFLAVLSCF
jgi:hypothetical protein